MAARYRIPITGVTVFATSSLLVLSVTIVLLLGFGQAAKTTRELRAEQAESLIDSMQRGLRSRLQPVRDQALWVAEDIHDLTRMRELDAYMLGVLAATPQVAGIAVMDASGKSQRWHRDSREMLACIGTQQFDGETLKIRIGINTGPVVAGAIGETRVRGQSRTIELFTLADVV